MLRRAAAAVVPFAVATVGLVATAPSATADAYTAPPAVDHASCMGLGSSFYGVFAPQQRAFVAEYVIERAAALGQAPGEYLVTFATEKEGGAFAAPCGTQLE